MCRPTCQFEEQLTTSAADVASQQANCELSRVVLHVAATIKKTANILATINLGTDTLIANTLWN